MCESIREVPEVNLGPREPCHAELSPRRVIYPYAAIPSLKNPPPSMTSSSALDRDAASTTPGIRPGSGTRPRMSLDGEWEFTPDPERSLDPTRLAGADPARRSRSPGPGRPSSPTCGTTPEWPGTAVPFAGPSRSTASSDVVHLLCFGAVDYFATRMAQRRTGGRARGRLPAIRAAGAPPPCGPTGENELIVRVIDPGSDADADLGFPFAEIPHGKQSWYGPIGGIWQSVLSRAPGGGSSPRRAHHPRRARGARAGPPRDQPPGGSGAAARSHAHGTERRHAAVRPPARAGRTARFGTLSIPEPELWDTENPRLYTPRDLAERRESGPPLDQRSRPFRHALHRRVARRLPHAQRAPGLSPRSARTRTTTRTGSTRRSATPSSTSSSPGRSTWVSTACGPTSRSPTRATTTPPTAPAS